MDDGKPKGSELGVPENVDKMGEPNRYTRLYRDFLANINAHLIVTVLTGISSVAISFVSIADFVATADASGVSSISRLSFAGWGLFFITAGALIATLILFQGLIILFRRSRQAYEDTDRVKRVVIEATITFLRKSDLNPKAIGVIRND